MKLPIVMQLYKLLLLRLMLYVNMNFISALEFNSDVPHPCSYCEKEFRCWTDFVVHLQQANYICRGCLDFFTLTPWFAKSELIAIEVNGGANLFKSHRVIDLDPMYG